VVVVVAVVVEVVVVVGDMVVVVGAAFGTSTSMLGVFVRLHHGGGFFGRGQCTRGRGFAVG
jgi:hypothetical protein